MYVSISCLALAVNAMASLKCLFYSVCILCWLNFHLVCLPVCLPHEKLLDKTYLVSIMTLASTVNSMVSQFKCIRNKFDLDGI